MTNTTMDAPKTNGATKPRSKWLSSLFNFRFFSDEMPKISPHAVIDPSANIDADVEVGPFCVIGPDVTIGPGCRLLNSVTIIGKTAIGRDNVFFPNCVIGTYPQDKKFKGGSTELTIGSGNVFREAVTVHIGTEKGGSVTRVADNNLFMVNSHIGHDAQVGSNGVFANNVMMAGHVVIGNNVSMMGGVGLHHFVRVGDYAYIGGYARIHMDVPPFVKVDGDDEIRGLNKVGMSRGGMAAEDIAALDSAYRKLFAPKRRRKPLSIAMSELESMNGTLNPLVMNLLQFLREREKGRHGRFLEARKPAPTPAPIPAPN